MHIYTKNTHIKNNLKITNDVSNFVFNFINSAILPSKPSDINIDFGDIYTLMDFGEIVFLSESEGKSATLALKKAIEFPLLNHMKINNALAVIIHFTLPQNSSLEDISNAMSFLYELVQVESSVIFGTTTTYNPKDNIIIRIIATG